MGSSYLWIKALHVIFVVSWFAGLLYLPRIFVNLALIAPNDARDDAATRTRLLLMAHKLLRFMTGLGVLAVATGMVLLSHGESVNTGWMQAKLALVLMLIGYHAWCAMLYTQFADGSARRSDRWLRWFNEVPVVLLAAIVILVVVKPF